MLMNDSIDNGESQSSPQARGLGGEERIENSGGNFGADARAVVANFDENSPFQSGDLRDGAMRLVRIRM